VTLNEILPSECDARNVTFHTQFICSLRVIQINYKQTPTVSENLSHSREIVTHIYLTLDSYACDIILIETVIDLTFVTQVCDAVTKCDTCHVIDLIVITLSRRSCFSCPKNYY